MKTTVIMIRHGQSEGNLKEIFTGQSNTPLTELGHLQARLAAEALNDVKIDKIYASDLCRAYDTALPTAKAHGLEIIPDERLREICAGDWEGVHFEKIRELYPEEYSIWMTNLGAVVCPNGESIVEMCERVISEVLAICEDNLGKTVCIATHATPIRAICALTSGIPVSELEREPFLPNASISVFEYENGELKALKKGDTSHLAEHITTLPKTI